MGSNPAHLLALRYSLRSMTRIQFESSIGSTKCSLSLPVSSPSVFTVGRLASSGFGMRCFSYLENQNDSVSQKASRNRFCWFLPRFGSRPFEFALKSCTTNKFFFLTDNASFQNSHHYQCIIVESDDVFLLLFAAECCRGAHFSFCE